MRAVAVAVAIGLMIVSPAMAQQPSPSQTALQIDNVINQWAQQIEADQRVIADLKKQLEDKNSPKPADKK